MCFPCPVIEGHCRWPIDLQHKATVHTVVQVTAVMSAGIVQRCSGILPNWKISNEAYWQNVRNVLANSSIKYSTYTTFLRVLVRMQNTLQAAIFLSQLTEVNIECFFNAHDIKVTACRHWWLYDPAVAEISFSNIIDIPSTLPALHRFCTTAMPATCKVLIRQSTKNKLN